MAGQVGHDEQQIAKFFFHLGGTQGLARFGQLLGFLDQLIQNLIRRRPVKADAGRAFLQFHRPCQAGQAKGHPVQHPGRPTLGGLGAVPVRRLLPGGLVAAFRAEDMRMPQDHLVTDRGNNRIKVKKPSLVCHLRVVNRLEQQIAQFTGKLLPGGPRDDICHLMRLFHRIGRDGCEGLLNIPGAAAVAVAQTAHDFQQAGHAARRIGNQCCACRWVKGCVGHCGPAFFGSCQGLAETLARSPQCPF